MLTVTPHIKDVGPSLVGFPLDTPSLIPLKIVLPLRSGEDTAMARSQWGELGSPSLKRRRKASPPFNPRLWHPVTGSRERVWERPLDRGKSRTGPYVIMLMRLDRAVCFVP